MHQRVFTQFSESPYYKQLRSATRRQKPSLDPARRILTENEVNSTKHGNSLTRKVTLGQEFDFMVGVQTCKGTAKGHQQFNLKKHDISKKLKTECDSDMEAYQHMIIQQIKQKKEMIKPKLQLNNGKLDSSKLFRMPVETPQQKSNKPQRSLSTVTPKQKSQERQQSMESQSRKSTIRHEDPIVRKVHPKVLWDLSDEEWNIFGDRFPIQFEKKKLLGRGGFSLVWLGEHRKTKEKFAIKQILSNNTHQSHMKEIWFGGHFFENGQPKLQFQSFPGCRNLVRFLAYDVKPQDTWIFQEICGESLGNHLYDLRGENLNNERVYRLYHRSLYGTFRKDLRELKKMISDLAAALDLLQDQRIVHSDLKTENILVKKVKNENQHYEVTQIKLIDYGSSFPFDDLKQFSMATPEYMCPEILNYILYENSLNYNKKLLRYLQNYKKPWVIDVWSLGCVVLEIISGIPLWMSLKTIVSRRQKEYIEYGLFAVKGRVFDKIIERQIEVVSNLDSYIDNNFSGIRVDSELRQLLKEMLSLDPDERISPKQIIEYLKPMKENLKTQ